jgi:thiol:disulfide interchange protein
VLYLTAAQPVAAEFKRLKGVLVANGGPAAAERGGWAGEIDLPLLAGVVPQVTAASASEAAAASVGGATAVTFWFALAGAFVGGLILNLMPCVFPVLSLKLVGLMQHERADAEAGHPHASLRAHGIAFAAGVVLGFILLAGLLLALRAAGAQLGWGFQLQTPWVIAALLLLFFLVGLNLIGAYEIVFGGALASGGAAQRLHGNQLGGSFATGLLAVVIAAPCTAPFMGAALGYAITQPAPIALAVFAMLGVGMATPYVALTWMPAALKKLPRPGVWMLRFKQVMAFPMFATCAWLVWVLAQQIGLDALALVLGGLVLVAFAAWAYGLSQAGTSTWRWVALAAAPLALYALFAGTLAGQPPSRSDMAASLSASGWQPWSRAAVQAHLAAGKPVFVDFTAAWCVTCQANKRMALNRDAVREAFDKRGVVLLRADWTSRDDEITRELARFNRNGVPLYVLYDRSGTPRLLPELLTEHIVLDALERL